MFYSSIAFNSKANHYFYSYICIYIYVINKLLFKSRIEELIKSLKINELKLNNETEDTFGILRFICMLLFSLHFLFDRNGSYYVKPYTELSLKELVLI